MRGQEQLASDALMSGVGQSRPFGNVGPTTALALEADLQWRTRHVAGQNKAVAGRSEILDLQQVKLLPGRSIGARTQRHRFVLSVWDALELSDGGGIGVNSIL
jgi:hypothetical protein